MMALIRAYGEEVVNVMDQGLIEVLFKAMNDDEITAVQAA